MRQQDFTAFKIVSDIVFYTGATWFLKIGNVRAMCSQILGQALHPSRSGSTHPKSIAVTLVLWASLSAGAIAATPPGITDLPTASPTKISLTTVNPATIFLEVDNALNRKDAQALGNLISPNFTHSDGYNQEALVQGLAALWKQYPSLTYQTEIVRFDPNGTEYETVTTLKGQTSFKGQRWKISGEIRAIQAIEANKIRSQTILSETTQVQVGEQPPTLTFTHPATVNVGSDYNFDVVVEEPINDDLLIGGFLEEPVSPALLVSPAKLNLEMPSIAELLTGRTIRRRGANPEPSASTPAMTKPLRLTRMRSGGFFKIGRASNVPETRWISAAIARHDGGITIATTRLRTVKEQTVKE